MVILEHVFRGKKYLYFSYRPEGSKSMVQIYLGPEDNLDLARLTEAHNECDNWMERNFDNKYMRDKKRLNELVEKSVLQQNYNAEKK